MRSLKVPTRIPANTLTLLYPFPYLLTRIRFFRKSSTILHPTEGQLGSHRFLKNPKKSSNKARKGEPLVIYFVFMWTLGTFSSPLSPQHSTHLHIHPYHPPFFFQSFSSHHQHQTNSPSPIILPNAGIKCSIALLLTHNNVFYFL
jgi:hypothetical protein